MSLVNQETDLISLPGGTEAIEVEKVTELITFSEQGPAGPSGATGASAYQLAVALGFVGTPEEWIESLKGSKGDPGVAGVSYHHAQAVASDQWVIDHNLNRYPSVTVVDSSGDEVEGDIRYVSSNQIIVSFCAPFGGDAYLN